MSNDDKRFSEEDLLKKGFVRDGAGVFVKADATGFISVEPKGFKPKTPMLDKALRQVKTKSSLFAKGRLKKGVMNKTEASYARHLDALKFSGEITWWAFEKIKLMLADNTSITLDFAILYPDGRFCLHDTKGAPILFQDDAKAKMKIAAEMFPFEFFVVYPRTQKMGGGWDIHQINPDKNK